MRPIVSGNGSLIETISKFLNFFIQPIVKKLPSYLKDTTEFLNKLNHISCVSTIDWLVTLDVTSHTNITHEAGLDAIYSYYKV